MSKQMTPCERLGYKVGDSFKVVDGSATIFAVGSFITLIHDDGTLMPRFKLVHPSIESDEIFFPLIFVEKVATPNPAEQDIAGYVRDNGDWHKNGELPPVGEVCEWLECSQTWWQTVTVAGYYLNAAWLVPKGKEPITVYNPTGFRPLRTEREKAIDEMVSLVEPLATYMEFAGAIYDAGMYKEVK